IRCRNRQQYFFLLDAAQRFFCMHNLLQKMDLRSHQIRSEHLSAEEFGNEAELILQKRKGLEVWRSQRLRFQVRLGWLFPFVRGRWPVTFGNERMRTVGFVVRLKGLCQDT